MGRRAKRHAESGHELPFQEAVEADLARIVANGYDETSLAYIRSGYARAAAADPPANEQEALWHVGMAECADIRRMKRLGTYE